jgi:hypothetical protein
MKGQLTEAVRAGEAAVDSAALSGNDRLSLWALEAMSLAAYWAGDIDRALSPPRCPSSSRRRATPMPRRRWPAEMPTPRWRRDATPRDALSVPELRCSALGPAP